MAKRGSADLQRALSEFMDGKANKLNLVPAFVGAYINGQKTIRVADRPDYIWVRVRGSTSDRLQAFNAHPGGVAHHWDLPILIFRDPAHPTIWKVYGRDIERYDDWEGVPYSPPHGPSHSFLGGKTGDDPVWLSREQILPLLPHPVPTGTMGIDINSDIYYFGGRYHWFAGTGTASLESYKPTGSVNGRFVTVYIDADKELAYLQGDEFNMVIPPADPSEFIPIPTPDQGVPVAAVRLTTGTHALGWGDIYDLRFIQSPVPPSGSSIFIYDEGTQQGIVDSLDFSGEGIQAIVSGSFGYIEHSYRPGVQAFHCDRATALINPTGLCWLVGESQFATGSLGVSVNGIVQTPSIDYNESQPGSGTFCLTENPPTGSVITCWYGVYL